jgi:hypothetical protein
MEEKFAALIRDKARKDLVLNVLTVDATTKAQAAAFLKRGAEMSGWELFDGSVYLLAELPEQYSSLQVVDCTNKWPRK